LKKIKSHTFGVVGLGNFGSSVARELQRFGNHVMGIDVSEARVATLADTLSQAMIVAMQRCAMLILVTVIPLCSRWAPTWRPTFYGQ